MQKENIITILASVALSVLVTTAVAPKKAEVSTAPQNIDASIETYLKANPTIITEVMNLAAQKEREEAEKRLLESYKANIDGLHNIDNKLYVGPKDAKITIVEFFDFNCGYCKRLAPALLKAIKNNPDVRFVFKPVGFLSDTSITAAKAMLAAAEKGKFFELYEGLLTYNGRISNEVIDEQIKKVGLDVAEIKELMNSTSIEQKFEDIAALSRKVEVRGVPTMIINGSPLRTIDYEPIQRAIDNLK